MLIPQFKKLTGKFFWIGFFILSSSMLDGQVNSLELDPVKEKKFSPYMYTLHGGAQGVAEFKTDQPHGYLLELWYYSESFYIKRNHFSEGAVLNEEIIDISRFESSRKESEEALVTLPGFKDALVLLPLNALIYKP